MKLPALKFIIIILFILGISVLIMPSYLRKALIFQHAGIDDFTLFYNRAVSKGDAVPLKVHSAYNTLSLRAGDSVFLREFGTVAYLVIYNDSILYEEYLDGYSSGSFSNSFSMAKSIVSLLIGCLEDEGKISIDEKIGNYIENLDPEVAEKITVKDLLTMSSGLDWDESYNSAFSKTTRAYYGNDLLKLVSSLELEQEPGKIFNYQSCNTQLLGMIIEKVSGKTLSEYASEKLWKPLGAEHDALWSLDVENGIEKAYCCFNSNARDFSRIGLMILNSGAYQGRQIISKEYLIEATTPANWLKDEQGGTCNWYGYHIWLHTYKGHRVIYTRGILGQYIFVIPDKKAVIVRLGKKRNNNVVSHVPEDVFHYLDAALYLIDGMDQSTNEIHP
jgi:CubicO group peptidase (beta-lactamase class C family)